MAPTKSRFCGVSTLLLCAMIVGAFQPAAAGCGGFKGPCIGYSILPTGEFTSQCSDYSTSIELNPYISNHDGNLIEGAGFADTCGDFRISEDTPDAVNLFATCKTDDPNYMHLTAINLNDHISVDSKDNLVWNNCRRRRSLLEDSTVKQADKLTQEPVTVVVPTFTRRMTH